MAVSLIDIIISGLDSFFGRIYRIITHVGITIAGRSSLARTSIEITNTTHLPAARLLPSMRFYIRHYDRRVYTLAYIEVICTPNLSTFITEFRISWGCRYPIDTRDKLIIIESSLLFFLILASFIIFAFCKVNRSSGEEMQIRVVLFFLFLFFFFLFFHNIITILYRMLNTRCSDFSLQRLAYEGFF